MRKRYQCQRIRQINGMIEVFFKCVDGNQEEYILINIVGKPEMYEIGKYYDWSDRPSGY